MRVVVRQFRWVRQCVLLRPAGHSFFIAVLLLECCVYVALFHLAFSVKCTTTDWGVSFVPLIAGIRGSYKAGSMSVQKG